MVGYEVTIRMGISMGLALIRRGLYSPSICGTFGAAAAAAKILECHDHEIEYALRVAATQASGLYTPSLVKRLSIAFAAQKGLVSVLAAREGFTSEIDIFQDTHGGLYRALAVELQHSAFNGLGRRFGTVGVAFKQYSCARPTFTTLDAIQSMRRKHEFRVEDIRSVVVWSTYSTMSTGYGYEVKDIPSALVSIPYCASVMLTDSRAFVDQFTEEKLRDKKVRELMSKIEVRVDPTFDKLGAKKRYAVRVEINLSDGRTLRRTVIRPSGDPQNQTPRPAVISKYRLLASKVLDKAGTESLQKSIYNIQDVNRIETLTSNVTEHLVKRTN